MTFQKTPLAKQRDEFTVVQLDLLQFVQHLSAMAKTPLERKEERFMYCLTEFDPSRDPGGYRRQANFVCAYGLVLDFDGGSLSAEEFVRIFWTEAGTAGKRSFIITNSFSRSAANPNRFRVILLFKRPATSLAEFQAVHDSVVKRLEDNGYTAESAKLDSQCRSGIQPFWVPCTNRAHKSSAFFRKCGLDRARDIEKFAIDPATYLATAAEDPQSLRCARPFMAAAPRPSEARKSEIRLELQRAYGGIRKDRHIPIFVAANRCAHAGLSAWETEVELTSLFGMDRKAQAKIRDAVDKLRREGAFSC